MTSVFFHIGSQSVPFVLQVTSVRHSITFTLGSTDVYDLKGILQNIVVFYQPVDLHTPTTKTAIPCLKHPFICHDRKKLLFYVTLNEAILHVYLLYLCR